MILLHPLKERGVLIGIRHPLHQAEEDVTADFASGLRDPGQPVAVAEPVADPPLSPFQGPSGGQWSPLGVLLLEHPAEFGQAARIDGPGGAHGEVGGHEAI